KFSDTYSTLSLGSFLYANINKKWSANAPMIDGVEADLWSEAMPTVDNVIYMSTPKISGIAEAAWSQSQMQPNWQNLAKRLGCGKTGFLAYLNQVTNARYRGFPNGITKEVPHGTICK